MRGDRVPIRSLEFRDFWVLDISQPSHSTREAGGPSTVGVGVARTPSGGSFDARGGWPVHCRGSPGPRAVKPFLDCRRRCQASRTRLLRPACDALRTQYCSKRAHCLSRTLVLVTGTAARDHVLSMPNVFILWTHNLPTVAAKLISFAAFY